MMRILLSSASTRDLVIKLRLAQPGAAVSPWCGQSARVTDGRRRPRRASAPRNRPYTQSLRLRSRMGVLRRRLTHGVARNNNAARPGGRQRTGQAYADCVVRTPAAHDSDISRDGIAAKGRPAESLQSLDRGIGADPGALGLQAGGAAQLGADRALRHHRRRYRALGRHLASRGAAPRAQPPGPAGQRDAICDQRARLQRRRELEQAARAGRRPQRLFHPSIRACSGNCTRRCSRTSSRSR